MKTCRLVDFAVLANRRVKIKGSKKRERRTGTLLEKIKNKKLWNMRIKLITIVIRALITVPRGLEKLENGGWIETIQTTALTVKILKVPGNHRRLAVTWAPVKDHHLTLMWKKSSNNNNNHNTRIRPREWDAQGSLEFWDTNWFPDLCQMTRPYDGQQKRKDKLPNSRLWRTAEPHSKNQRKRKKK